MAILAGALAPALIKYINKSRISTDIQTGNTIASGIQTALSGEKAFDAAKDQTTAAKYSAFWTAQGKDMQDALDSVLGTGIRGTKPGKAKKDFNKNTMDQEFYVIMDTTKNKVEVYAGSTNANNMVYPTVGSNLVEK